VTRQPSQRSSSDQMREHLAALSPGVHARYDLSVETWRDLPCRYVAVARDHDLDVHPYTVVTTDLTELSAALNLTPAPSFGVGVRPWRDGRVAC
jgi:hypothetical protein